MNLETASDSGYLLPVFLFRKLLSVPLFQVSVWLVSVGLIGLVGCGSEIGDSCAVSSDCSEDGDRICDSSSTGGYCTVVGCAHDSCPDSAVCVQFFSSVVTNLPCDPNTEDVSTNDCSFDEICTLGGVCVPGSSEVRYCMKACTDVSNCRNGYECRDAALMQEHGGQPVEDPENPDSINVQAFCAEAPL